MAKLDKSNHTKQEYRRLKALEKAKKREAKAGKPATVEQPVRISDDVNILCVKHGIKYSADYVNTLYNMISRHCNLPFKFFCLTDNPNDINPNIHTIAVSYTHLTLPTKRIV